MTALPTVGLVAALAMADALAYGAPMTEPTPNFPDDRSALFFDFDGTLVDLAAQPDAIQVHPDLTRWLAQLEGALQGALAVVSGRPLAEIDDYLQPLTLCAAGVHGVEWRGPDRQLHRMAAPGLQAATALIDRLVQKHPALRMEPKPGAVALHYRQAPELQALCEATMAQALALADGLSLMHGKRVLELMPARASKGQALQRLLALPPFEGRRPWFFGDDVTDESAFEAAQAVGGVAVKVGAGPTCATTRLPDPAALRAWISAAAQRLIGSPEARR
jgi:trehalose 6-phosphate phosphatase